MSEQTFDITPFLTQDEGQHFDRKSLYSGEPGAKRPRDRRTVRGQVAEYISAFANAEGGVLLLGVEDDREVTGHALPPDALNELLLVPQRRLRPAQPAGFEIEHDGKRVVVFDVPASDVPVQLEGDGFFLRMGDKTVAATEEQIRGLKFHGFAESWEARPSPHQLESLDADLLAEARRGAGHAAWSDTEYLLARKLADMRGPNLVLRRAAELVFSKGGPEHPNASVRIFRVIGAEVHGGTRHNVEERPRIEGNLSVVLRRAFAEIEALIRRPSRLVGTRFRAAPEYPDFSWKEALLNAVAHRDYAIEGRTTEAWFFDDRMEVRSPGGLVASVVLDELLALKRVHASRNPRTVRALVDLGFMRDQGEGIPRMFHEMADRFLPAPRIETTSQGVVLVLGNTPTLTAEDHSFLGRLGDIELGEVEFRALLEARRMGRIDNGRLREVAGLDTLAASILLRKLRDRGLLELHAAGSQSYYTVGGVLSPDLDAKPTDLDAKPTDLDAKPTDLDAKPTDLDAKPAERPLSGELLTMLGGLGAKSPKKLLSRAIIALCQHRPMSAAEIAKYTKRNQDFIAREYLRKMVKQGSLRLENPDTPNDPRQRYFATQTALE